ncbi:MAG: flagellar biosynthesis protein FlhF [Dechloromonas sp.]|nr:flagellar biosynthesis protein FlhF [Dechloromonas sp.]
MNVRKFFASSSRQALYLVRESMGPDALILSNHQVEGGVEILAMAQADMPPLAATTRVRRGKEEDPPGRNPQPVASPIAVAAAVDTAAADPATSNLASEIKSMRGMIEEHLSFQAWDNAQRGDPGKAKVLRDMLLAGFSPALARQFLAKMPHGLGVEKKLEWVKAVLDRNLRIVATADEIVQRGGVYALIGPTGVGKTTTVAKIAARCVVRYGAERLALLTTDGYRIGAHEQLRIYGKLLGVRVIAIKDTPDLQYVLDDLRGKHLVLIDTVGMSQRDRSVPEQLAMLSAAGTGIQRLLLLNAAGNGETLDDVVRVYRDAGVHGCIITKADEAVRIATVLDVVIRHQLPLHYVTDGQRVPEDLHLPDRESLLRSALCPVTRPSAHHLDATECQLMLASSSLGGVAAGASFA